MFTTPSTPTAINNRNFLLNTDDKTANMVIDHIAKRYGITDHQVFEELYGDEAECLTEYMTGGERNWVYLNMLQLGYK